MSRLLTLAAALLLGASACTVHVHKHPEAPVDVVRYYPVTYATPYYVNGVYYEVYPTIERGKLRVKTRKHRYRKRVYAQPHIWGCVNKNPNVCAARGY